MSLAALIAAQRAEHGIPVAVSCRVLGVSQAWFHKWRNGDHVGNDGRPWRRRSATCSLNTKRRMGRRGSARICARLGWRVSKNTVAKLMAEQGLAARRKHQRRSTTTPEVRT